MLYLDFVVHYNKRWSLINLNLSLKNFYAYHHTGKTVWFLYLANSYEIKSLPTTLQVINQLVILKQQCFQNFVADICCKLYHELVNISDDNNYLVIDGMEDK